MPIGDFAPGPYSATYKSADAGLIKEFWTFSDDIMAEPVVAARYGDSVIDYIYRGRNCYMGCTFIEWDAGVLGAIHPWDADLGETGAHGRLFSDMAGSLVLTAIAGSPAATKGPATFTALLAIHAPDQQKRFNLGCTGRDIPMIFQLLPAIEGSQPTSMLRHFTTTNPV